MKVYVAAPFELRDAAIAAMHLLEQKGYEVTSRWLTDPTVIADTHEWAVKDLEDIALADVLILLNPEEYRRSGTGGRHVEVGYALALNKVIVVVGVPTNIFHRLNPVRVIPNLEHL